LCPERPPSGCRRRGGGVVLAFDGDAVALHAGFHLGDEALDVLNVPADEGDGAVAVPARVAADLYAAGGDLCGELGEELCDGALGEGGRDEDAAEAFAVRIGEAGEDEGLEAVEEFLDCGVLGLASSVSLHVDLHSRGTPGRMWILPLTTLTGTQRSSWGKRNCVLGSRASSVGRMTMRRRARRAGVSVSKSFGGWPGLGTERAFMRSKASWLSFRGRLKALAMES
jgi:hypothetical protein